MVAAAAAHTFFHPNINKTIQPLATKFSIHPILVVHFISFRKYWFCVRKYGVYFHLALKFICAYHFHFHVHTFFGISLSVCLSYFVVVGGFVACKYVTCDTSHEGHSIAICVQSTCRWVHSTKCEIVTILFICVRCAGANLSHNDHRQNDHTQHGRHSHLNKYRDNST